MSTRDRARPEDLLAEGNWLRALAAGLLRDTAAAEDAVQDAWVAAYRRLPTTDRPVRPWLFAVLRNAIRSRARADRQRRLREMSWNEESRSPTPEELLSAHEELRTLAEMVSGLEEPYRATVLLCYHRGLTPSEVARKDGIPAGTVRWRLKQALDELRSRLDQRHGGDRKKWRAIWGALAWRARGSGGVTVGKEGTIAGPASKAIGVVACVVALGGFVLWWTAARRSSAVHANAAEMERRIRLNVGETGTRTSIAMGILEGRITNPDGTPAASAQVFVTRRFSLDLQRATAGVVLGPLALTTAKADGWYRMAVPVGRKTVYAMGTGGSPVDHEPVEISAGKTTRVDLALGPGGFALTGHVLDAGGGPIPGARVIADAVWADLTRGKRLYEVRTDSEGMYRIVLGEGQHWVRVEADGYAPDSLTVFLVRAETRDVRLFPGARFSGRVIDRDTRRPVAGADVSLVGFDQTGAPSARVLASDAGEFTFASVAGAAYRVIAAFDDRLGASGVVRAASGEAVGDIEVSLGPAATITGRIIDEGGRPIADATVSLRPERPPFERFQVVRSGADGGFRIPGVFLGAFTLHAEADGFGSLDRYVAVSTSPPPMELKLGGSTSVSGTVSSTEGQPVEGAIVRAGSWASATTSTDGSFRITNVQPGEVTISARHPDRGVAAEEPRIVRAGERIVVTLRLDVGTAVSGTIRYEDASAAQGAKVVATSATGSYQTISDQDGHYRLQALPPGTLHLYAFRKDRPLGGTSGTRPDYRELPLTGGKPLEAIDLTIARGGQKIGGVVLDPDGQPVPGANVSVRAGRDGPRYNETIGESNTVTNDAGRFLIEDLIAGTFVVRANHPRFAETELVDVKAGAQDAKLMFARPAAISGLLERVDGLPVAGSLLRLVKPARGGSALDKSLSRQYTSLPITPVHDSSGAFSIEPLEAGRYDLAATAVDGAVGRIEVEVQPGQRLSNVHLVLRLGVRLHGRVVDEDTGEGLPGVDLYVGDESGKHQSKSGPDGVFELAGLADSEKIYLSLDDRTQAHLGERLALARPPGAATVDVGVVRMHRGNPRQQWLGFSFSTDAGRPQVVSVESGSIAERSGLKPKDVLVSINGENAATMPIGEVVFKMRGVSATTLVVQAGGEPPREVTLPATR